MAGQSDHPGVYTDVDLGLQRGLGSQPFFYVASLYVIGSPKPLGNQGNTQDSHLGSLNDTTQLIGPVCFSHTKKKHIRDLEVGIQGERPGRDHKNLSLQGLGK